MILAILFVGSTPLSLHPVGLTNVDLYSKLVRHELLVKCLFQPVWHEFRRHIGTESVKPFDWTEFDSSQCRT